MLSLGRTAIVTAPGTLLSCVSFTDAAEKSFARGSELADVIGTELVGVVVFVLDCALDDLGGVTLWHAAAPVSTQTATPSQTRRTVRG